MTRSPATVDVHAHVVLPAIEKLIAGRPELSAHRDLEARRNGPAALAVNGPMVAARIPQLTRVERRLADMDRAGVDVQVVTPSPHQYSYWADEELARTLCRTANEGVAEHCAQAPDRLVGVGLIPLQHPALAVELLDHAVRTCGLAGVEISSHAPLADGGTVELSHPDLEPLWARAAELGVLIVLHPFGCTLDERLDRWYLTNIVGQPVENAVALSHLVFAGVLDRHPGLKLIASHGGGYLPTFLGRADHAWTVRPDARGCAERPSAYLRRIWFDSLVHTPDALRALVAAVGVERVLMGSDYPFDMGVENPVERLVEAGLGPAGYDAIRGGNAAALLASIPGRGAARG